MEFAHFVRPAAESPDGRPRAEPCLGYLVEHPRGTLLFDTGMGADPDLDAHYRPRRVPLETSLGAAGSRLDEVRLVANCHLHFDHCGGNPRFEGKPVYAQRVELAAARTTVGYTLPELVDSPGLTYELLDGEAEILPGVTLVPTPGHTPGHQSLIVRRDDGTVIVAGQTHDGASSYSADALGWRLGREGPSDPLPPRPGWFPRLLALDPARVVFAHDHSVWEP